MNKKSAGLFCLLVFLVGCSGRTSAPSLSLPAGVTDKMQPNGNPASFWVDHVGGKSNPFAGKSSIAVAGEGMITVDGWAIDELRTNVAGGVEAVIDGKPYKAEYGISRVDVAGFKHNPAYTKSGFKISFPANGLAKGTHAFVIRVIASDGSSYYSTPEWAIVIQ